MADVVYRAAIPLTRVKGPLRLAEMPTESEPVRFGTHGPIARHYGIQGEVPEPHATTLDYVIAATGGLLLGTLGGALEARGITASEGHLTAVAHGEVEVEDGVLLLRRIHVVFVLKGVPVDKVDSAQRAHDVFKMRCPVYRSVYRAIDVTTELKLDAEAQGT
jgi:uncharacterized OsmC-like protein